MAATSIYNVMDYGATGNGTIDDTAAINSALSASVASPGGGICYIPDGTFLISNELSVAANTHLIIDGTVNLGAGANHNMIRITGSAVLIEGKGVLNGNGSNQSPSTAIGGIINNSGISDITIRGLTIENCFKWGVSLTGVTNGTLENLILPSNGAANEFAVNCTNCWARGLRISGTKDYGFAFYSGVTYSGITDSQVSGSHPNIGILADTTNDVACSHITIANNICSGAINSEPGIAIHSTSGVIHTDVTIVGNETYDNVGGGIFISSVSNCTIANNSCHNDTGSELEVDSAASFVNIIGNNFYDVTGVGVKLDSAAANVALVHNLIWASSGNMTYCLTGGPINNSFVHGNFMGGWNTGPSSFSTTGTNFQYSDNTAAI